ncbi:DNA topoisomerase III [Gilliamella sp. W8126]|uniref:type IA DNA topoisomerase n=1 Tax=Gilliamella sp. W8126 TaxID=2750946 RepID=UPI0018DB7653|nr:type IA DNA topoisomerase [Gilliamella sp. W8126]MBI0006985.1 DNA topoisomerase III [Gilliamella sp. W8126]
MNLIIAEKPQLAQVISEALGVINKKDGYIECKSNYTVTWALGHVLEIKKPEEINPDYKIWKSEDLPLKIRPLELQPIAGKLKQFNTIKNLLKQASIVINAGDPDDEGQLLIREILDYTNFKGTVKRLLLNDLNIDAAKKAMSDLKNDSDYDGMYYKALARSQADYIFGINLTRAYTLAARSKNLDGVYSVGRVQTPTLGLIVNRFLANKNHIESYYYNVSAEFDFSEKKINARLLITDNINSDSEKKLIDENIANKIASECKNKAASVLDRKVESKTKKAPLPFSLLDLQVLANNKFGYLADETLKATQSLREKYKAITYNRSDCRYLTSEQFASAPATLDFLKNWFKKLPWDIVDATRKSKAFNDKKVTAHTGIIPVVPDKFDISNLSDKETNIYNLIVEQYIIQFLPDKTYQLATLLIECCNYQFKTSSINITEPGWSNLISDLDEIDNVDFEYIVSLEKNDSGICNDTNIKKNKTRPLPLYTDATLLQDLQSVSKYVNDPLLRNLLIEKDEDRGDEEKGGIGTPATRSQIISNLNAKGFFEYKQKKLVPTEKGINFINALPKIVTVPDMTAVWFEQQRDIEQGKLKLEDFINQIDKFVEEQIKLSLNTDLELPKGQPCKCGAGTMILKIFKDNKFFSCSNYPECKITLPALNNRPAPLCPCCNSNLKINFKVISCECGLTIWQTQFSKELNESQLFSLLTNGKTNFIKGFKSKAGKDFSAKLILDKKSKKINLEFEKKKTIKKGD